MKKKINIIIISTIIIILFIFIWFLYELNIIPHLKYENKDFDIEPYVSNIDKDNDGIDDQNDILNSVREYIKTKPKYKSKYYSGGYSSDHYGVCTDVVINGLRGAGYELMDLVDNHIRENQSLYNIKIIDKNIDFRRVKNLNIYFKYNAISLTTDIKQIEKWQGGDIVVFKNHIGIVSDKRNRLGIPFVIHHANPYQIHYEEDILGHRNDIIGHFRIS